MSHQSQLILLISASIALFARHLTSGTTIDLPTLCAGNNTSGVCILTDLTSSYENPLVLSNNSLLLPLQLLELTIRNSAVGRIPTALLEQIPKLQTFTMYNCGLNRIVSRDFESSRNVQKLILQMNRLFDLPPHVFEVLQDSLEELYLGHDTIHIVHRRAFTGLTHLRYLDLQHNNIWDLQAGVFEDLISLEHIDLSHNKIDMIDAETFGKNTNLKSIVLSGNLFSVFEPNSLAQLPHLHQLDLSNTMLDEIHVRSVDLMSVQSSGLKKCIISGGVLVLNASNNALDSLEIKDKQFVRSIDMHDNLLESLDDFDGMLNLQTLDVSHNRLTSLRSTASSASLLLLPGLVKLNVASNRLENITMDDLLLLTRLDTLDLAFNKLQQLDADAFEPLVSLEQFYIEGNRLHQFDFIKLKRSHELLHEFGLYSNPWDDRMKLEAAMKFLQQQNVLLPNRFERNDSGRSAAVTDIADVSELLPPMKIADLQELRGLTAIHPYWTKRDVLALITLVIVLIILLLLFYRIMLDEECCQRRFRWRNNEAEPLRAGQHQRLIEENSQV